MSFLRKIFGESAGEMLEAYAAMLMPMFLMIGIILFFKLSVFLINLGHDKHDMEKALNDLPQNSKEVILEITKVNKKTSELLQKLQDDLNKSDEALNQKKADLSNIEKKIKILTLTPEQRKLIEEYNKTVTDPDISVFAWLKQKTVWYDIAASVFISVFFYWLGRRSLRGKSTINN